MDQEDVTLARIEQLLQENLELTQETNDMLRDMRRLNRIGFWAKVVLWALVIILPFLLIGPILKTLIPAAGDGTSTGSLFGLPSSDSLQKVLQTYQGGG